MLLARMSVRVKILLLVLLGLVLTGAAFLLGYKSDWGGLGDYLGNKEKWISAEVKILRPQTEIIAEYRDTMTKLLGIIDSTTGYKEILESAEARFFDIYVPNDIRDLHLRAFLDIKKIAAGPAASEEELKLLLKPIIEELLQKNNELTS